MRQLSLGKEVQVTPGSTNSMYKEKKLHKSMCWENVETSSPGGVAHGWQGKGDSLTQVVKAVSTIIGITFGKKTANSIF